MARDDKPLRLRPVDEDVVEPTPVVRLENLETESRPKGGRAVRLGTSEEVANVSQRLALPDKEEIELRTHQPGIEVLIEPEAPPPELVEENWGESAARRNPVPWGWFVLIGLAICWAVAWSLKRLEQGDEQVQHVRVETRGLLVDEEEEEREAASLIDRIERVIRAYFDAKTVESMAALSRQSGRVMPLMRQFYGDGSVYAGSLKDIKTLQPLTLGDRGNFWMSSVTLSDGSRRNLIVEIDESGTPRVDWETMVCYQPMKWDDYARQRPAGQSMDFRVYVEPDTFYSHEFADSKQWMSFKLTSLKSEETLFGYARCDSELARELVGLIQKNAGRSTSMILRLVIPEGLKSRRGVVIEKMMSPRWLYIDPPDSDS